jgi:hypothetical protein
MSSKLDQLSRPQTPAKSLEKQPIAGGNIAAGDRYVSRNAQRRRKLR